MAPPHVIRLRGPWEFEALEHAPDGPTRGRIKLPADNTPIPRYAGPIRYARRFQRPSGLGPAERVWLVITVKAGGVATLNGNQLGELQPNEPTAFDVTEALVQGNLLALDLQSFPPSEVWLEIRR